MKRPLITLVFFLLLLLAADIASAEVLAAKNAHNCRQSTCADTTKAMVQNNSPLKIASNIATNSASTVSNLSAKEVQHLLELHNKVRSDVGVSPLIWSTELAIYAHGWANNLASMDCDLRHRPRSGKWKQKYGENLFIGTSGYYGVADAVRSWESEKIYYQGQTLDSSNCHDSGHYTQMVWKTTEEIGCAKAECNGNSIVVCNYNPPGNVLGQKPY